MKLILIVIERKTLLYFGVSYHDVSWVIYGGLRVQKCLQNTEIGC